jgi:hypothetical protein
MKLGTQIQILSRRSYLHEVEDAKGGVMQPRLHCAVCRDVVLNRQGNHCALLASIPPRAPRSRPVPDGKSFGGCSDSWSIDLTSLGRVPYAVERHRGRIFAPVPPLRGADAGACMQRTAPMQCSVNSPAFRFSSVLQVDFRDRVSGRRGGPGRVTGWAGRAWGAGRTGGRNRFSKP